MSSALEGADPVSNLEGADPVSTLEGAADPVSTQCSDGDEGSRMKMLQKLHNFESSSTGSAQVDTGEGFITVDIH